MSRYIDAEALKAELSKESVWATLSIVEVVDDADSVDVVECIDCEFCKEQGGHVNGNGYLYCTRQKMLVDESCFCSWGERRE